MAEDDGLGAERAQGEAGVLEGLAFFDGGGLVADQGGGGAEGLGGELEGGAGAGAGLVEEQGDAAAGEQLGPFGGGERGDAGGAGEDVGDFGDGEVLDAEEGAGVVGFVVGEASITAVLALDADWIGGDKPQGFTPARMRASRQG